MRPSPRSILLLNLCLGLCAFRAAQITTFRSQIPPRITAAVDDNNLIQLHGNVHPLVRPEFDRGAVAPTRPMKRMLLLLKRSEEQEAALQDTLEKQHDKSSRTYHQWLTPAEFGALYGPADADIQTVTQWLASKGLTIDKVYTGRTVVEFSGTAEQVEAAFSTTINNYEVRGKSYVANANDPHIPAALVPVIAGVVSLNNFPRQSNAVIVGQARKVAGKSGIEPLFTLPNPFGGSGNFYALSPGDFATIYHSKDLIASGNDGTGQTVAIVGETNLNVADVQAFRQMFGLPANFTSTNVILNGPDPGVTSPDEETEADLDVQWSGAVAPGAKVDFVVSASTSTTAGIDLSALYIVENNLAGVMSDSYGACESYLGVAGNGFYKSLWEQAAAQGITAIVSAGDNGSSGCDDTSATTASNGLAVNGLASTPYNVALGGTDFDQINNWNSFWSPSNVMIGTDAIGTSALSYIPEIPWSNNCAQIGLAGCGAAAPNGSLNVVAGSGGPSATYPKPKWQMGVSGVPNDSHRDLPDVSLFASSGFSGSTYIVCNGTGLSGVTGQCTLTAGNYIFSLVGGTSASAPAFAGIMALVNQKQSTSQNTAPRQGIANYVLYALANKAGASCTSGTTEPPNCIFNDVTHGNGYISTKYGSSVGTNSVPCQGGSPNCSSAMATQNGVLVEPGSPTAEAWTATAGYDLATGLGSMNVNNLATTWGTVSTVATVTALTLNPKTGITHGANENVSMTIVVTPQSGTATGDVALIATLTGPSGTTQRGLAQYTLAANGTVSAIMQSFPGGTYSVAAHYAGDGTNAPSDSAPVTVSVSPEASKTFADLATFDINGNPTGFTASSGTYGSGYSIFRVDVGDASSAVLPNLGISSNCSKMITTCPAGIITLTSTGTPLGISSFALNNLGYAETVPLSPGNYSVTSSYSGDASYGPSSSTASFTINKAPTTVSAGVAGLPVQYADFEQIAADVLTTSVGAAPTGTFRFSVDGVPIGGSVPIDQSAAYYPGGSPPNYAYAGASSTAYFMSVGNHTLSAQYSGDVNYAGSTGAPVAVTVTKAQPSFGSYGASPNTININQQVTLTAQMFGSDKGVTPTGTITFYAGNSAIPGTVTYAPTPIGSGLSVSMPYTPTTPGTFQINVNYSGDLNYLPVTNPVPASLTVVGPDFGLAPQPPSVVVAAGNAAKYTIAVSTMGNFNSNVSFTCSVPAAATTCTANPATVAPGSTTTITVATIAHQMIPPTPSSRPFMPAPKIILVLLVLAFLLAHANVQKHRRFVPLAAVTALVLFFGLLATSCGGGSSGGGSSAPFGTQAGNYTVTIIGTSGQIAHTTTVSLTVN